MSKNIKLSMVVLLGIGLSVAQASQMKLYEIKSGKVTYEIKGSGEIMGQKMQTVGKKRVIFDDYGARNLTEEVKVEKQVMMGQKKVTKTHMMTYMKEGTTYQIDFDHKRIMRVGNAGAGMAMLMGGGTNMKQAGEEMMKKMGGKKTGTDKVLGYVCDVWYLIGTKQCIYKGLPLRVETDVMGIKNREIATKAAFDISLSKDDFKLPEFPIYDMEGNQLDRSKLDVLDKQAALKAKERSKEMAELGEVMSKAAKEAGVKKGQRPTKAQEKSMEDAMMNAMLPQVKQKMLKSAKAVRFGKKCFSDADTLKEADICGNKMDEMIGEKGYAEDKPTKWDAKTKKEVLKSLEQGLKSMECVEKANNMQEMQKCMR